MRGGRVVLVSVLVVASLGCSALGLARATPPSDTPTIGGTERLAVPDSRFARVEIGMSASEAESLLGKPLLVEQERADGPAEVWYYQDGVVVLRNGKVVLSHAARISQI